MTEYHTGHCLCGAVSYRVAGKLRDVVGCHCSQCRRQTGLYYATTSALDRDFELNDESGALKWYRASPQAQRGFCSVCGSALFWKADESDRIAILAGSLDQPTGLRFDHHIFVADKGDFYELLDGLPQHTASH